MRTGGVAGDVVCERSPHPTAERTVLAVGSEAPNDQLANGATGTWYVEAKKKNEITTRAPRPQSEPQMACVVMQI